MGVITSAARDATSGPYQPGEEHHRNIQGGAARAAVFGASDGLLTNVSVILGVAGANPGPGFVRLAGIAALLGGAFSMAAGEYISMTAQNELIRHELDVERDALRDEPEAERKELVAIYVQRGVRREVAEEVAESLMRDPALALETHSREELGINPRELGKPKTAALSSFVSFSLGAVIPLVPWLFTSGRFAIVASIVLGGVAALAIGWGLGVATGRSRVWTALRQLALATVAAAGTFAVGSAFGVRAT